MAENSKIEWTDHTFNPWTGCTKVSPGCEHCYAEGWAKRSGAVKWGAGEPRRRTSETNWKLPLKWNRQAEADGRRFRVFCASLADVFDNAVPEQWRADLFDLIRSTPNLDWLLLTKRIGNAIDMLPWSCRGAPGNMVAGSAIWPNVWLGATIVNQTEADRDIPKLLATPASVRFLSMEPLLGPVSLRWLAAWPENPHGRQAQHPSGRTDHLDGLRRLDWIIVGGESGPGARPMHPDWARSLRDQCAAAGVPFLFKQWGEWVGAGGKSNALPHIWMTPDGRSEAYTASATAYPPWNKPWKHEDPESLAFMAKVGKKIAGRLLDGRTHDEFPEAA